VVQGPDVVQGDANIMSQYENYSQTASSYDTTRSAIGSEIWLGQLLARFKNLNNIKLLDAGSGTGNYTLELAPHIAHITAFDMNDDMLGEARTKVQTAGLGNKVDFQAGQLLDLPFENESFDVVMFNQVLHHLEPMGEPGFANHQRAIIEAARILRKGGVILINACSKAQMRDGYWYYSLIPNARDRGTERTIGTVDLHDILNKAGFAKTSRTTPLDAPLLADANFNAEGPLDEKWRAGDSIWAYASDDELAAALNTVREMRKNQTLDDYMKLRDKPRHHIGQATFWSATKMS
jgi:ubiquinone/menaquinone biosynthesis C-methylase UbiE